MHFFAFVCVCYHTSMCSCFTSGSQFKVDTCLALENNIVCWDSTLEGQSSAQPDLLLFQP